MHSEKNIVKNKPLPTETILTLNLKKVVQDCCGDSYLKLKSERHTCETFKSADKITFSSDST